MSRFSEYMSLIPKGLQNPELIVEGYLNNIKMEYGLISPDKQEEILRRRLICAGCPEMSTNAKKNGFISKRKDEFCTLCSCPIKGKTASMDSSCGADSWNKTHPDQPKEVKWLAFKPEDNDNKDKSPGTTGST